MFGNTRIKLVSALILAFGLSIYTLWFKPMWDNTITSSGGTLGIGETAVGFFLAIVATMMVQWFIMRRLKET